MRKSPLKTPTAVLRSFLGFRQHEFAELIGCSVSLLQAVELGKRNPTPEFINRIAEETGVSELWLYGDSTRLAPFAVAGIGRAESDYTRRHFELAQLEKQRPRVDRKDILAIKMRFILQIGVLMGITRKAYEKDQMSLFRVRVSVALGKLRKELGASDMREEMVGVLVDVLAGNGYSKILKILLEFDADLEKIRTTKQSSKSSAKHPKA